MARAGSQNILLATIFAVLSYLPFPIIAKVTIQICALLFILDPIPPFSRLVSLTAVGIVFLLSKWERELQTTRDNIEQTAVSETSSDKETKRE